MTCARQCGLDVLAGREGVLWNRALHVLAGGLP